jgi:hypothetical protein
MLKTMNLAKLKKWFQRCRHDERRLEDRPAASPPDALEPVDESGSDPMPGRHPAGRPSGPKSLPAPRSQRPGSPASAAGCEKPAPAPPRSRQGIPILKPDEDLATYFRDAGDDEMRPGPAPGPAGPSGRRQAAGAASSQPVRLPRRRNRAGVRQLDADADLRAHFLGGANDAEEQTRPDPKTAAPANPATRAAMAAIPTNRHGIPRLDGQADLCRLFDAAEDASGDGQDLGEALRKSLDHDARGLMKKKTGGIFPSRRLVLKEKLRRYPAPQAQLDLHGATASKAHQQATAFIRRARADGLFTVRIIVGKGLHSEGGAVLPDVVEDLLVALKREDLVLSYRWEKRIKRKSGALIVFLETDFP